MTADVHRLTGNGPITEPEKGVIEKLRELLERAEAGDIKGFGYFIVRGNDFVGTGWAPGIATSHLMVSGASMLQYRVVQAIVEDE